MLALESIISLNMLKYTLTLLTLSMINFDVSAYDFSPVLKSMLANSCATVLVDLPQDSCIAKVCEFHVCLGLI